jgi:hypothetical protein
VCGAFDCRPIVRLDVTIHRIMLTAARAHIQGLLQGASKYLAQEGHGMSNNTALWISAVTGAGCALVALVVLLPILRIRATKHMQQRYCPIRIQIPSAGCAFLCQIQEVPPP